MRTLELPLNPGALPQMVWAATTARLCQQIPVDKPLPPPAAFLPMGTGREGLEVFILGLKVSADSASPPLQGARLWLRAEKAAWRSEKDFLVPLAGAGPREAGGLSSRVASTQLGLASMLSDTAGLPDKGEGCRGSCALAGCSWHSSRFSPDTGQGPLGHAYPGFKPLGAPAHWPLCRCWWSSWTPCSQASLWCRSLGTQPQ